MIVVVGERLSLVFVDVNVVFGGVDAVDASGVVSVKS